MYLYIEIFDIVYILYVYMNCLVYVGRNFSSNCGGIGV